MSKIRIEQNEQNRNLFDDDNLIVFTEKIDRIRDERWKKTNWVFGLSENS